MTEGGHVDMPLIDVWMTKEEIADMLGLSEAIIARTIRTIYKNREQYEADTMQRIPFPRHEHQGWTIEVYNLDFIIYLTYKLRSPYEHICIIVDDVDFRQCIRNRCQRT